MHQARLAERSHRADRTCRGLTACRNAAQRAVDESGVTTGAGEIDERVVQALEVADNSMAGLPGKVAGLVLIALGSSAGECEDLARSLAGLFRQDLVAAVESTVNRALLQIGHRPGG